MYSIQDLENLSGIKAHTIRIWEKRYDLLTPLRTDTNIRLYSDDELRKLLNVTTLISNGGKISKISKLSDKEIANEIDTILSTESEDENIELFINNLIASGLSFDVPKFESSFSSAMVRLGLKETYVKVLLPALLRIGLLWGKSEIVPAQEHLISNLIKQKLFSSIDGLPTETNPKQKNLLFLPPNEDHEIGLLLTYYLLKQNGHQVYYLGANVPLNNISVSIELCKPDSLVFFAVRSWTTEKLQEVIDDLRRISAKKIFVLGSEAVIGGVFGSDIEKISSVEEFKKMNFV